MGIEFQDSMKWTDSQQAMPLELGNKYLTYLPGLTLSGLGNLNLLDIPYSLKKNNELYNNNNLIIKTLLPVL